MKTKKIPMRKCIATGEMKPKKELIRVVRTTEGTVVVDPSGKVNGRGAYLSLNQEAVLLAKKKRSLQSHLEVVVDDSVYADLLKMTEK